MKTTGAWSVPSSVHWDVASMDEASGERTVIKLAWSPSPVGD
ncbi:hypothetical protein ACWG8W_04835 [Citricoccus zhacaiensis]